MKPIIEDINKLIHKIFKKQHPILAELIINWGKIVGIKYSDKCCPIKVTTEKQNGKLTNVLHISADNSSVAMELSYLHELMIERIAIYFGYKAVHKIKLLIRG